MEHEERMERNLSHSYRITEIPPNGEKKRFNCPYCKTQLHVGVSENGDCSGVTTVCKRCKRMLLISHDAGRMSAQANN